MVFVHRNAFAGLIEKAIEEVYDKAYLDLHKAEGTEGFERLLETNSLLDKVEDFRWDEFSQIVSWLHKKRRGRAELIQHAAAMFRQPMWSIAETATKFVKKMKRQIKKKDPGFPFDECDSTGKDNSCIQNAKKAVQSKMFGFITALQFFSKPQTLLLGDLVAWVHGRMDNYGIPSKVSDQLEAGVQDLFTFSEGNITTDVICSYTSGAVCKCKINTINASLMHSRVK